jgi:hypothetical protein
MGLDRVGDIRMAEPVFPFVAKMIERSSELDILEARGTLRFALKSAGIAASSVTAEQMTTIVQNKLPAELKALGVESADLLCEEITRSLKAFTSGD